MITIFQESCHGEGGLFEKTQPTLPMTCSCGHHETTEAFGLQLKRLLILLVINLQTAATYALPDPWLGSWSLWDSWDFWSLTCEQQLHIPYPPHDEACGHHESPETFGHQLVNSCYTHPTLPVTKIVVNLGFLRVLVMNFQTAAIHNLPSPWQGLWSPWYSWYFWL